MKSNIEPFHHRPKCVEVGLEPAALTSDTTPTVRWAQQVPSSIPPRFKAPTSVRERRNRIPYSSNWDLKKDGGRSSYQAEQVGRLGLELKPADLVLLLKYLHVLYIFASVMPLFSTFISTLVVQMRQAHLRAERTRCLRSSLQTQSCLTAPP